MRVLVPWPILIEKEMVGSKLGFAIRWEVFAESLQDYQLLQTLKVRPETLAGEFMDYNRFPKSATWVWHRRRQLLTRAGAERNSH